MVAVQSWLKGHVRLQFTEHRKKWVYLLHSSSVLPQTAYNALQFIHVLANAVTGHRIGRHLSTRLQGQDSRSKRFQKSYEEQRAHPLSYFDHPIC